MNSAGNKGDIRPETDSSSSTKTSFKSNSYSWSASTTKFDTQPITAFGHRTVCESTSKLLSPHPRESERQELLRIAESGHLAFRRIEVHVEEDYFTTNRAPRPFSLALPGEMIPVKPVPEALGRYIVGISDPQCLFVYKRDPRTERLLEEPDMTPDTLPKKLLSDLQSLHDNRRENANRVKWRLYPDCFTSGHLREDGTFSLPKLKNGEYNPIYDFPELVLINYSKKDILCFFVYKDKETNISDILQYKHRCEEVLNRESLPLVVYCHRTGSVEVCFDDELDSENLANNERSLDEFAFSQSIDLDNFRALLNMLPMPIRAQALSSKLTVPPDVMHKLQQAIELVSDPCCYSYERLLELKQGGLPIDQRFFHNEAVKSLLDILLDTEVFRHNGSLDFGSTREDVLKGQPIRVQQGEEAYRLFQLLLQSGARLTQWGLSRIDGMERFLEYVLPVGIFNCLVAASAPFEFLTLKHLRQLPLTGCPGSVFEFDRICRSNSPVQQQECLKGILLYVVTLPNPTLEHIQSNLLALFHYQVSLEKDVLDSLEFRLKGYHCRNGKKVIDDLSVDDYIHWLDELYKQRKTHPFYQNWPEHVRQAQQEITDLKQSLGLDDSVTLAIPVAAGTPTALQFLVDAFSKPPVLPDNVGDNEKTILKVLQHYYRRPGPERVIKSLGRQTMPTQWKLQHSCSHVLRARNNGHWYMELLEKFKQCSLSKKEKELLSLAIIYHDAAAEDVDKSEEETRSADYFKRDLAGYYPEQLLEDMAQAMVNKEKDVDGSDEPNLSESVRWYLRILRFADRMDIIRCCGVGADFPRMMETQPWGFDATRLDLPTQLPWNFRSGSGNQTEFQRHLEAAMHGAADLARITGQLQDQRKKNYALIYGLNDTGAKISENFEWTTEPVRRMNQFIDDNVRRKIAQEAGIIVCSDPSHKTCKADQNKGITYGIHNSWYDLAQVAIPTGMTLLEKMQYQHDPSLLSPATQKALKQEVQRLKSKGIRMNTGTLKQETLASKEARKVLKKRGIAVIREKRRYFTNDDLPREREMLVPKKIAKPDAQSASAEWACKIL
ncbi:hypothetical protein [Endozoicomonas acroporae]|uniref:hypothetical protein n=1 Tax=Endozoicomonas acroporae TaxID=1701104 RepID=UPI003D7B682D